jgi:hypothetical protein
MFKNVPRRALGGVCYGIVLVVIGTTLTLLGILGILDGFFLLFAGAAVLIPGCMFISEDKKRRLAGPLQ